ncbi:MAG TPA: tetratricopeptide repeat protein [Candidatus Acidoferrales bacterium]|nr:tetratricopeptide repeat protein [Candidatus Acidoferrales bacterium]
MISRYPQFARNRRAPGRDAPAPTVALFLVLLIAFCAYSLARAQSAPGRQQSQIKPPTDAPGASSNPDDELQIGTDLTRQGHFHEAVPHLLAAQGRVSNEFAADFNLALCYTATNQFEKAIALLSALSSAAHPTDAVYDLLAQAYVGNAQPERAFTALQQAATLSPSNEKLYVLVADACMDHQNYVLGVKVVNLGMQNLPHSARLFYERGVFQTLLERGDLAAADFAQAAQLAPETEIAYMASAQQNLVEGKIPETIAAARQGIAAGQENYILFTLLGEALIRSGVAPGQPEFAEAQAALEKSVAAHPDNSRSQIALAKIYLMAARCDDAITHLEIARQLDPANTSVYSHLATAYRQRGQLDQAQKMLAILANLNEAQAAKIRSGPSDHEATSAPSRVE